eukprot:sb/3464495/
MECHSVRFNLTYLFTDWVNGTSSDMGVVIKDSLHEKIPGYFLKFGSNDNPDETMRPYFWTCQKKATCEPVDAEPQSIEDSKGCVSVSNVTLNNCVAKNGPCPDDDGQTALSDLEGYTYGTTAMWDEFHQMQSACKCCVETETEIMDIPMDCSAVDGESDYTLQTVKYIKECQCQKCSIVSSKRKKSEIVVVFVRILYKIIGAWYGSRLLFLFPLFVFTLECAAIPSFALPRHTRACSICQVFTLKERLECASIPSFAMPRHTATRACSICQKSVPVSAFIPTLSLGKILFRYTMALNWIKDVFTDTRILSATVCGAAIGASVVYTLTKPEKKRGGSSENSKWDKKPLRDYCIKHTNIIEPKPLVLLRQKTAVHERGIMESTHDVGQLLVLLMRMTNAKNVLETVFRKGGLEHSPFYPGVALLKMAYELPKDGKAYAMDVSDEYCNVGKPFMEMAGLRDQ